jgi:hypothetical protein
MVVQAGIPDSLIERHREYVEYIMREEVTQISQSTRDPRLEELIIGFLAGGSYMLLSQWVINKMPFSAEQMGQLLYKLIAPSENI